jgi:ferrous iron transport protein B
LTLLDLNKGEKAIIIKVRGRGAFRKRILEMGFVIGKEISIVKKAPLRDPVEYSIMGYNVSLRNSEAALIEIVTESEAERLYQSESMGAYEGNLLYQTADASRKVINVAFVGNPNSGKTTIFNYATGLQERVGNYGGVTVDAKESHFKHKNYSFIVTDLPGTYSITAYSPEELFVREFIAEKLPDVVVNIIDSSNLERNLYLTTQLIDMDIKVVGVLNMFDEHESSGDKLDYSKLGQLLGIPFIPTVGSKGKGLDDLYDKIIEVYEDLDTTVRHIHINYGSQIEKSIQAIQEKIRIPDNQFLYNAISSRFLAIKMLELDKAAETKVDMCINSQQIFRTRDFEVKYIHKELNSDPESLITDAKYGFIAGALKETVELNPITKRKTSDIIDVIITHKVWGIPIFIFFMWLTFFGTFKLGQYPMTWIQIFIDFVSIQLNQSMSDGILKDLLIQGIIGGVGGVLTFLPNILLLYLFISLMEDTGYMARAVFIMDKAMHKIGLHGKSFIPLLMGFGCNVPAILSTRIIESRRDRLITMLILPFMSCSARLPIYILLISAFFPHYQGTILFLIYMIGVLLAIGSALFFKKVLFPNADIPFVMELPPYRMPTMRTLSKHMWHRAEQYLKKIGGIILAASIIIWALGYFPREFKGEQVFNTQRDIVNAQYSNKIYLTQNRNLNDTNKIRDDKLNKIYLEKESVRQQNSYIGRIGQFLTPIMSPLGFDWKMSVAIITGIAAKEVVVGTLGVLYQTDLHTGNVSTSQIKKMQEQTYQTGIHQGQKVFSPRVAFSFMLFILIYFPCIAVIASIRRESGALKWALFSVFYTTGAAYILALSFYQLSGIFI